MAEGVLGSDISQRKLFYGFPAMDTVINRAEDENLTHHIMYESFWKFISLLVELGEARAQGLEAVPGGQRMRLLLSPPPELRLRRLPPAAHGCHASGPEGLQPAQDARGPAPKPGDRHRPLGFLRPQQATPPTAHAVDFPRHLQPHTLAGFSGSRNLLHLLIPSESCLTGRTWYLGCDLFYLP